MNMEEFKIITTKAHNAIAIREKVKTEDIPQVMGVMFGELMPVLNEVRCIGPPFAYYHSWSGDMMDMEVGFPIKGEGISKGRVRPFHLPAVKAVVAMHIGPYDKLHETYSKIMAWMERKGVQPADYMWEEYLNSPQDVPPEKLQTRLYMPIK